MKEGDDVVRLRESVILGRTEASMESVFELPEGPSPSSEGRD